MKIRNSILLPAVCLLCSCSSGNEKMDKASCAEAFAEAYGLVRWFYPGDMPEGFRAIPYHSIGKKRGILQGYLLPELKIEIDGEVKLCRDVYVAVSEELCGEETLGGQVKMILNPALLAG